ncbi:MAG: chemotaxis protein CheB [Ferruginibacter sp.]
MSNAVKKEKASIDLPPKSEQDFPIVGIGASAGGLDAFKRFLKAIPEDSGMAYVLVQHLIPSHESILPDILSRVTKIPVNEISDDIHLAPDNIYVIPANKTLTATDGVLKLTPREKLKTNLTIDVFFRSLAEVHHNLAVGVVLSGTASDGTLGLKSIKENGGFTFAQDQQSAAYGDMPRNAVNAEVVDFVLPPEKIPAKLVEIMHMYKKSGVTPDDLPGKDEVVFKQIILILHQYSKVDFTYYKQTTIRRRIARRMAINKKETLSDYLKFIRKDKAELTALFQDMLIPVTSFFRDPAIFETINNKVFPALLKTKSANKPIRIWVAGCSTGEEAYSLAISLNEFLGEKLAGRQIQLFASDISEAAIAKARIGIYDKVEFENVSNSILKNYFTKNNGSYQVNRQIRDMCVFAVHNFLKDPPFAKIDLLSCRNVLIYMDAFLQKKSLTTFHYALKNTGILLLGKSETCGPASELYSPFFKNEKIYSPKQVANRFIYSLPESPQKKINDKDNKSARNEVQQTDFRKNAESILLSQYTPASVIVNEEMDVVHIHGNISPFLEPPQGRPTFNLLKMAREGLAFELRNALHKAKTSNAAAIKTGIPIKSDAKKMLVDVEIVPLKNTVENYYLILFRKTWIADKKQRTGKNSSAGQIKQDEDFHRIEYLEKELAQNKEDMRSITEDQEASNEELQSANEELLSGSEELQSLNEELETSKEELQSSNEELIIVNQELIDKHDQINTSRIYTEAIIATLREPLVVLDKSLRIKSINTAFSKKFNITEAESEGNFFYEIQNCLFDNSALRGQLEKVVFRRIELNDFEFQINLQPVGEITLLLNARFVITEKNNNQLILLAFEDITERKVAQLLEEAFSESLETKIREKTASLEQTNLQLEQFAHTASHELQEPLRKIVTFSTLLQQEKNQKKPGEIKKYLDKIEVASVRMIKLVNDMLNYASVTHHKMLFEKTDLNIIFKNILSDFELLIGEKKAKIICKQLPSIEAVPFQMNQLFYDLINNALKFSKPGVSPIIHISCKRLVKAKIKSYKNLHEKLVYYEIIFKDNGIGFNQKYAKQIFTMFQRLDASGNYPGTGIGLALCKKIVDNYGGVIYAEAIENMGASFHIILPEYQLPG